MLPCVCNQSCDTLTGSSRLLTVLTLYISLWVFKDKFVKLFCLKTETCLIAFSGTCVESYLIPLVVRYLNKGITRIQWRNLNLLIWIGGIRFFCWLTDLLGHFTILAELQ